MNLKDLTALASINFKGKGQLLGTKPLPKTILALGITLQGPDIIWFRKHSIAHINFSEATNIPSKKYSIPSLVFRYHNDRLFVVATKDIERSPTLKSMAYYAPFSNITDNDVCMGQAKPEGKNYDSIADIMEQWEDGFIRGTFTHNEAFVTKCKDLRQYYENVDFKNLKEIRKTVGEIFKG